MYPTLVLCFFLTLPLSSDARDCYKKGSYENCATCYETFANALVNSGNNLYEISRAFFPIDQVAPVEVDVTYKSMNSSMGLEYHWMVGGFYVYQPLKMFMFRSLLFSPPAYHEGSVTVVLPDDCFNTTNKWGFFDFATQRLKGYAQSQSVTPAIDASYVGMAVRHNDHDLDYYFNHGDSVVAAIYGIIFFITFMAFLFLLFLFVWHSDLVERLRKIRRVRLQFQANMISSSLVCVVITLYTTLMDIFSIHLDYNHRDLPDYYYRRDDFTILNIIVLCIYATVLLAGIICFFCGVIVPSKTTESPILNVGLVLPNGKDKPQMFAYAYILLTGSTLLSLTFHFPSILIAWASAPFYASRIAFYYAIILFIYFIAFWCNYKLFEFCRLKYFRTSGKTFNQWSWIALVVSSAITFFAVSLFVSLLCILVVTVPINNSIETVSDGITTIYNEAVLLIGGLLAYKIGWYYLFGNSFSVSDALQKSLTSELPPFKINDSKWQKLTEEGRLTEVINTIITSEGLHHLLKIDLATTSGPAAGAPKRLLNKYLTI